MEDAAIIDLFFERNEQAISETEQKYGKYCFTVANNILTNEQDSEECVNDTYAKAWDAIPPQKPNSLKLFLAKITRNLAFDKVKNESRKKRGGNNFALALDEMSEIIPSSERIEDELEAKELMRAVNTFLRNASPRSCNIFVCRYFYLYSIDKIGEKYGLSRQNVAKILSRTRIELKEYLIKEGYFI